MANYLQVGSSGSRVRELQELLNKQGYNLAVDGVYGSATKNAVRRYQQANKLGVDGIVGDETWGHLTGGGNTAVDGTGSATAAPPSATTPLGNQYNPTETTGNKTDLGNIEGMGPTFQPSTAYKDALAALQGHQAQQPGLCAAVAQVPFPVPVAAGHQNDGDLLFHNGGFLSLRRR